MPLRPAAPAREPDPTEAEILQAAREVLLSGAFFTVDSSTGLEMTPTPDGITFRINRPDIFAARITGHYTTGGAVADGECGHSWVEVLNTLAECGETDHPTPRRGYMNHLPAVDTVGSVALVAGDLVYLRLGPGADHYDVIGGPPDDA